MNNSHIFNVFWGICIACIICIATIAIAARNIPNTEHAAPHATKVELGQPQCFPTTEEYIHIIDKVYRTFDIKDILYILNVMGNMTMTCRECGHHGTLFEHLYHDRCFMYNKQVQPLNCPIVNAIEREYVCYERYKEYLKNRDEYHICDHYNNYTTYKNYDINSTNLFYISEEEYTNKHYRFTCMYEQCTTCKYEDFGPPVYTSSYIIPAEDCRFAGGMMVRTNVLITPRGCWIWKTNQMKEE